MLTFTPGSWRHNRCALIRGCVDGDLSSCFHAPPVAVQAVRFHGLSLRARRLSHGADKVISQGQDHVEVPPRVHVVHVVVAVQEAKERLPKVPTVAGDVHLHVQRVPGEHVPADHHQERERSQGIEKQIQAVERCKEKVRREVIRKVEPEVELSTALVRFVIVELVVNLVVQPRVISVGIFEVG